jgi:uncharacterized membrane protein YcaP (DUF421 family)
MFFHTWADIWRVALASALAFVAVVAILRLVGQQALAKMSGFDVVFTVTLGSVVATVAVTKDVSLSEGLTALVTMLALQEIVRRLQSRSLTVHHVVRQAPRVVLWKGELLEDRLREIGVSADEVRAAVRKGGYRSLSEVLVVVLENDGEWSVVPSRAGPSDESALYGLPIPDRPGNSPDEDGHVAQRADKQRVP